MMIKWVCKKCGTLHEGELGRVKFKEKCDCGRMVDTTKEQVFDLKSGYTMLR